MGNGHFETPVLQLIPCWLIVNVNLTVYSDKRFAFTTQIDVEVTFECGFLSYCLT